MEITKSCDYDDTLNYTVIMEIKNAVVLELSVNISERCTDDNCSISIPFSSQSSNAHYTFYVVATNIFGSTNTSTSCTLSNNYYANALSS